MKNEITIKKNKFSFLGELSNCRSAIMGIAILWIMLFHSGMPCPSNVILKTFWYVFVSFGGGFGVNLFFILSGFGLYYSMSKYSNTDKINWLAWGKKRLIRLLPSYIIVSVIYYALIGELSLYNILQLNFWIDGDRDFWFIPGILVCYFLFPGVYLGSKKWGFEKMTIILLVLLVLGNFLFEAYTEYYSKIEIFTWRLPCFVIGVYFGYLANEKPNGKTWIIDLVMAVLFVSSIVIFGLSRLSFVMGSVLLLPVLTMIVSACQKNKAFTIVDKVLSYCGSRSLQLYLIHVSLALYIVSCITVFYCRFLVYFGLSFIIAEFLYRLSQFLSQKK